MLLCFKRKQIQLIYVINVYIYIFIKKEVSPAEAEVPAGSLASFFAVAGRRKLPIQCDSRYKASETRNVQVDLGCFFIS